VTQVVAVQVRDERPVSAISIATGHGAQGLPGSRAQVSIGSAEGLQLWWSTASFKIHPKVVAWWS
jgi:hypothetical protein